MFTDDSPDIKKYSFDKNIDKIVVGHNQLMQDLRRCILNILKQPFETLSRCGIFHQKGPEDVKCGFVIIKMKHISKDKPPHLNVIRVFSIIENTDFHHRIVNIKKLRAHFSLLFHSITHLTNWKNTVYSQFTISSRRNSPKTRKTVFYIQHFEIICN